MLHTNLKSMILKTYLYYKFYNLFIFYKSNTKRVQKSGKALQLKLISFKANINIFHVRFFFLLYFTCVKLF